LRGGSINNNGTPKGENAALGFKNNGTPKGENAALGAAF
jgi:hypothetical protein